MSDGLILKGQAIVVPQALRENILAQIHGRFGVLARNVQADRRNGE